MPRGARAPNPNRPQTLREARRAYQRAGRTPSLTAAQIRAAQRAVEADRRAKEILEKERRAKETKRRKEDQDLRQRSEHRRLVELGKLPEESLWGKVRASQPRLHNFFGGPPHAPRIAAKDEGKLDVSGSKPQSDCGDEVLENEIFDGDLSLLRQLPASAMAAPNIQKARRGGDKEVSEQITQELPSGPDSQGNEATTMNTSESQAHLAVPCSFSGSQLFSELADDAALEAELNGPSTEAVEDCDQVPPAGTQGSQYDLDGVNDDDLAGLVDTFEQKN